MTYIGLQSSQSTFSALHHIAPETKFRACHHCKNPQTDLLLRLSEEDSLLPKALQIGTFPLHPWMRNYCSFGICPSLALFRLCFVSLPQSSEAIRLALPLKRPKLYGWKVLLLPGGCCFITLWALPFHLVHKLVFHVSVITILYDYGSFNWLQAIIFFYKIEPLLH